MQPHRLRSLKEGFGEAMHGRYMTCTWHTVADPGHIMAISPNP